MSSLQKPSKQEEWGEIFKALKDKETHQPRILYLMKLSFKSERETNFFRQIKTELFYCTQTGPGKTLNEVL